MVGHHKLKRTALRPYSKWEKIFLRQNNDKIQTEAIQKSIFDTKDEICFDEI